MTFITEANTVVINVLPSFFTGDYSVSIEEFISILTADLAFTITAFEGLFANKWCPKPSHYFSTKAISLFLQSNRDFLLTSFNLKGFDYVKRF